MDLRTEPMDAAGLRLVEEWVAGDASGGVVFGGFYRFAVERWGPLLAAPERCGRLVLDDDGPAGFLDLEVVDGEAELAYYLAPDRRGRGLGHALFRVVLGLAREYGATSVHAGVEPGNAPALATLRAGGFTELGEDPYGDLELTLAL